MSFVEGQSLELDYAPLSCCSMPRYCRSWLCQVFIALAMQLTASAQDLDLADTSVGAVGLGLDIHGYFLQTKASSLRFQAELFLSNPTVFFPQEVYLNGSFRDAALRRRNDSMYTLEFDSAPSDTNFISIRGTCLAGNDSLCYLRLHSAQLDTQKLNDAQSLILIRSDSSAWRKYLRFAWMSEAFPLPSYDGQAIRWLIRLDAASEVSCTIYDNLGRALALHRFSAGIGVNEFVFSPDRRYYPGTYFVHMHSSTGDQLRRFVVIR